MAKKPEELDNLNKKERKEMVKSLRVDHSTKEKRTRFIVTSVVIIGVLAAVAGIVLLSQSRSKASIPPVGDKVAAMAAPNTALHIAVGADHVPYSTNPPTSGPHYNQAGYGPIACQVYTKEVKDESAVHNLEHGAVWVTYQDINDKDLANKLKNIVQDYSLTLLSPRAKDNAKIAVVAWEHILKLNSFDETKIRDFIRLYRTSKEAPEPMAGCGSYPAYL